MTFFYLFLFWNFHHFCLRGAVPDHTWYIFSWWKSFDAYIFLAQYISGEGLIVNHNLWCHNICHIQKNQIRIFQVDFFWKFVKMKQCKMTKMPEILLQVYNLSISSFIAIIRFAERRIKIKATINVLTALLSQTNNGMNKFIIVIINENIKNHSFFNFFRFYFYFCIDGKLSSKKFLKIASRVPRIITWIYAVKL